LRVLIFIGVYISFSMYHCRNYLISEKLEPLEGVNFYRGVYFLPNS
jgi:hypothetical protein